MGRQTQLFNFTRLGSREIKSWIPIYLCLPVSVPKCMHISLSFYWFGLHLVLGKRLGSILPTFTLSSPTCLHFNSGFHAIHHVPKQTQPSLCVLSDITAQAIYSSCFFYFSKCLEVELTDEKKLSSMKMLKNHTPRTIPIP
jgi:hypothetical protein